MPLFYQLPLIAGALAAYCVVARTAILFTQRVFSDIDIETANCAGVLWPLGLPIVLGAYAAECLWKRFDA